MKRVKAACLYQTLSFILDPNLEACEAKNKVLDEVKRYKNSIDSNAQILNETHNNDGSIEIEVRKKVGNYSASKYFN